MTAISRTPLDSEADTPHKYAAESPLPLSFQRRPLFPLGHVVGTPGALELLGKLGLSPASFLIRHHTGDWGDLDDHDKQVNRDALLCGNRLFSAYALVAGNRLWVITEADRSSTCLLLPSEY